MPTDDPDWPAAAPEGIPPPPRSGGEVLGAEAPRREPAWLVVIQTQVTTLLGRRFVLEGERVGVSADGEVVAADSMLPGFARLERRDLSWYVVDPGGELGVTVNDDHVVDETILRAGDGLRVGRTIFLFLSGASVEEDYIEQVYRITIMDGLTQTHNKRYLYEALEREIIRHRRHRATLGVLLFEVEELERVAEEHGHVVADQALRELARFVSRDLRRDHVFARRGDCAFAILLPESSLDEAAALGEGLQRAIDEHVFIAGTTPVRLSIHFRVGALEDGDRTANELLQRAAGAPSR